MQLNDQQNINVSKAFTLVTVLYPVLLSNPLPSNPLLKLYFFNEYCTGISVAKLVII